MLCTKSLFFIIYIFFLPLLRLTLIALKVPLIYKYLQKLSSCFFVFLSPLRNHYNRRQIDSAIIAETHSMNLLETS
jgi:hypothetical protein